MHASQVRFAVLAETQHGLGRDYCCRTATRPAHMLPPARAISIARARQERYALRQALFAVLQQHYKALLERGDVARSPRSGQTGQTRRATYPGRIQVAETVHLGRA